MRSEMNLSSLHNEVLIEIFNQLKSPADLCSIQKVCKYFLKVGRDQHLWKNLCISYYPENIPKNQSQNINYHQLFKRLVIQTEVKKSIIMFSLHITKPLLKGAEQSSSSNALLIKVKTDARKMIEQTKGKSLFQQQHFFQDNSSALFNIIVESCCTIENGVSHLQITTLSRLILSFFDFLDADFRYITQEVLGQWMQRGGLEPLLDHSNKECYLIKAYFLYCIFKKCDLTPFVQILEKNIASIHNLKEVLDFDNMKSISLSEPESCQKLVHLIVFSEFIHMRQLVKNLTFSRLCDCQGIDPNLLVAQLKTPSIIHYFLNYMSLIVNHFSPFGHAQIHDTLQQSELDVKTLLFKHQVHVGQHTETLTELLDDLLTLSKNPKLTTANSSEMVLLLEYVDTKNFGYWLTRRIKQILST